MEFTELNSYGKVTAVLYNIFKSLGQWSTEPVTLP